MTDRQSRRTTWLLAIWFLAGWATTTIATRLAFGYLPGYRTYRSQTFAPLGLGVEFHVVLFVACLFAGGPIYFWPRIARRVPSWEAGCAGYLYWLTVWFVACLVIAFPLILVLVGSDGPGGFGGGIAVAFLMAVVAMSFVAIWVLPRVLIPWLWLGAFATTDEHTRESATDVPADPQG